MNINNINQQSFNGGFRFKAMPLEAKNKIPEISNKWKQVFYDFENIGDVFLVTRDRLDSKVIKFVKDNNLKLEYYPQISTKCGLDTEEPERLSELLKNITLKPITTFSQAKKAIHYKIMNKKIEEQSESYVCKILKALLIDKQDLDCKIIKGINVIDNPEFERKIHISRTGKDSKHYVLIEPYSASKPSERYTITSEGKILDYHNTPDKIKEFYKGFRKSVL